MVDYSLATIMMPTTLCGSQIGTYVLLAFPPILIDIMLTVLLFLLGIQSARKGVHLHKKENAAFAARKLEDENKTEEEKKNSEYWGVYGTPIATSASVGETDPQLAQFRAQEGNTKINPSFVSVKHGESIALSETKVGQDNSELEQKGDEGILDEKPTDDEIAECEALLIQEQTNCGQWKK